MCCRELGANPSGHHHSGTDRRAAAHCQHANRRLLPAKAVHGDHRLLGRLQRLAGGLCPLQVRLRPPAAELPGGHGGAPLPQPPHAAHHALLPAQAQCPQSRGEDVATVGAVPTGAGTGETGGRESDARLGGSGKGGGEAAVHCQEQTGTAA